MAEERSIGDKCPICGGRLIDFGEDYPRLGCVGCKRVWVEMSEGSWATEARQVRIIKEPKIGDSPDDFLEPINQ